MSNWTFGKRIAAGFVLSSALLLIIGTVCYGAFGKLTGTSQWVSHTHEVLENLARVSNSLMEAESGQRGFILTGEEAYLDPFQAAAARAPSLVKDLRKLTADNPNQQKRLDTLEPLVMEKIAFMRETIDLRRKSAGDEALKAVRTGSGRRTMDDIGRILEEMDGEERSLLQLRGTEAESAAAVAKSFIVLGTLVSLIVVVIAGWLLTRTLASQIGGSVGRIQSSSAELQAAANQQATSTKEQATAMSEISTTISELLATSRQIAESAQRVAQIAAQTASAADSGDTTVAAAHESIGAIRQQVDVIVTHMLDLGKKSQQIGAVLDIVAELAEQTNILAINATIEAAGASEAGRRFAVVADEIRKLADRVAGSTKDIRILIDEMRSSVNATVMATEGGSKSVDAGARLFSEVASAFAEIGTLVGTTTEAAREIELSTKQQSTAVEQVNIAITSAAQATKETEASSGQTLQTAGELSTLSHGLLRIVQPATSAGAAA